MTQRTDSKTIVHPKMLVPSTMRDLEQQHDLHDAITREHPHEINPSQTNVHGAAFRTHQHERQISTVVLVSSVTI